MWQSVAATLKRAQRGTRGPATLTSWLPRSRRGGLGRRHVAEARGRPLPGPASGSQQLSPYALEAGPQPCPAAALPLSSPELGEGSDGFHWLPALRFSRQLRAEPRGALLAPCDRRGDGGREGCLTCPTSASSRSGAGTGARAANAAPWRWGATEGAHVELSQRPLHAPCSVPVPATHSRPALEEELSLLPRCRLKQQEAEGLACHDIAVTSP